MTTHRSVTRIALFVAAALAFLLAVWPTPYRYHATAMSFGSVVVRENRITGTLAVLRSFQDGARWVVRRKRTEFTAPAPATMDTGMIMDTADVKPWERYRTRP